jgi:membrane protease YdiL (CAAX protease family)
LHPLFIFLSVFIGALYAGALLTYPLYLFAGLFTQPEFPEMAITATQICGLAFSLLYLKFCDALTLAALGLKTKQGKVLPQLAWSFAAGLIIFGVLALALMMLGIHGWNSTREITVAAVAVLMAGAVLTGFAVGLFEETMFRGALQQGLSRQSRPATALVMISMIYAAVHFIGYVEPAGSEQIGWLTAASQFSEAYSRLATQDTIDAFLALFVLGLLLGLVRIRTGGILQCIGLHAGVVAGVKLFRFFTEYRPDNPYNYLVSSYDYRLGYLAMIWLMLITAAYYLHQHVRATDAK